MRSKDPCRPIGEAAEVFGRAEGFAEGRDERAIDRVDVEFRRARPLRVDGEALLRLDGGVPVGIDPQIDHAGGIGPVGLGVLEIIVVAAAQVGLQFVGRPLRDRRDPALGAAERGGPHAGLGLVGIGIEAEALRHKGSDQHRADVDADRIVGLVIDPDAGARSDRQGSDGRPGNGLAVEGVDQGAAAAGTRGGRIGLERRQVRWPLGRQLDPVLRLGRVFRRREFGLARADGRAIREVARERQGASGCRRRRRPRRAREAGQSGGTRVVDRAPQGRDRGADAAAGDLGEAGPGCAEQQQRGKRGGQARGCIDEGSDVRRRHFAPPPSRQIDQTFSKPKPTWLMPG